MSSSPWLKEPETGRRYVPREYEYGMSSRASWCIGQQADIFLVVGKGTTLRRYADELEDNDTYRDARTPNDLSRYDVPRSSRLDEPTNRQITSSRLPESSAGEILDQGSSQDQVAATRLQSNTQLSGADARGSRVDQFDSRT
jgi:hypothetical protein